MSRKHERRVPFLLTVMSALVFVAGASSCISAGRTGARVVSPRAYENAGRGSEALRADASRLRASADTKRSQTSALPEADRRAVTADAQTLEAEARNTEAAAVQLEAAGAAGESVYASGLFFTVEPLVAIGPGLEATAIPALGVNWRLGREGDTPLALQLVLGGALNPQSDDSTLGAAVGLGLSHPVSDSGALSIGFVFWDDGDDVENGVYVSLNLGNFGKTTK